MHFLLCLDLWDWNQRKGHQCWPLQRVKNTATQSAPIPLHKTLPFTCLYLYLDPQCCPTILCQLSFPFCTEIIIKISHPIIGPQSPWLSQEPSPTEKEKSPHFQWAYKRVCTPPTTFSFLFSTSLSSLRNTRYYDPGGFGNWLLCPIPAWQLVVMADNNSRYRNLNFCSAITWVFSCCEYLFVSFSSQKNGSHWVMAHFIINLALTN